MIIERKEDLLLMEIDRRIVKLLEKYHNAFIGDRIGEVGNAENIYGQEGRRAEQVSGEVESLDQLTPSG